jgi:ABC-type siderophore export system fused ATPase/permease subunit
MDEARTMGYAEYEGGGALKVLGAIVIVLGMGLAGYLVYLSRGYWLFALILFVVFLILGSVMISRGGYARKQNTPMGRVEDVQGN